MSQVIINADDYGLSEEFNKGIIELIKKGIVTSTTVMVYQKFVNPQELLSFQEEISIGVHLELREESDLKEIEKQIQKFQEVFGKLPSHMDGHKHCHLSEKNLPKVIEVAKKYNLPVRSRFDKDRELLRKRGIKTPDRFISWHPNREGIFLEKIDHLEKTVIEIVCHPGYYDKNSSYPYNEQREKEIQMLEEEKFINKISRYKRINYYEI